MAAATVAGADELKEIDKGLATGKVEGKRQWYVNRQGQTMMMVPKPGEFWMGEGQERHRQADRPELCHCLEGSDGGPVPPISQGP